MTNLDLAVIGNSIIGALIDSRGRISWCCFPRFDGDPVFCSLLSGNEPDSGFFDIEVEGLETTIQFYRTNTAIVTTTLTARDGAKVRITDFAPRFKQYERIFRPKMLVRRIEPESGTPHVRVRLRPRFRYGELKPEMTHGSNHIRYTSPDMALRLTTDAPISYVMEERFFNLDGPLTFVLGEDEVIHDSLQTIGREFLDKTEEYWHEWVRYLSIPFEWQDAVIRAAITLKLCSYEDTGAIVAALTTSIPESSNSGRDWDYRFCWLRDAYFVVHALNRLGATRTMEEFIRYIANIAALEPKGILRPVYGIIPALDLAERVEPALSGYRGMGPVRVGNLAVKQIQNDSYGSAVLAAAQMFFDSRLSRRGDITLFRTLEKLGEQAARFALEPDAGLWEYRTRQRVHTHSVLMCWATCDRLAKIAHSLGLVDEVHRWQTEADRLRKAILENAWNESRQSFVSEFGGEDLDASLLLLYEVGLLAPDDPRFISTLAAIEKDLVHNGNLFRYRTKDDFGWPQTAFTVCTFWYIDALSAVGRKGEARAIFERLLAARNHVGLLSEDIDPTTGELWGNFPQSYSMVGLIISAMRLSKTWEEAFWRGS